MLRQVPEADLLAVDRRDRGPAGGQRRVEALGAPRAPPVSCSANGMPRRFKRLRAPSAPVLPLVAEAEHERGGVVDLELPQDVAGAEAAADPEHHRLDTPAPWWASTFERAAVSGWTPPRSVQPWSTTGPRRVRGDDVAARRRVALPGAGHARTDAGLQVLALGHRWVLLRHPAAGDPRARAARRARIIEALLVPPRTGIPFASARPGGVGARQEVRRGSGADGQPTPTKDEVKFGDVARRLRARRRPPASSGRRHAPAPKSKQPRPYRLDGDTCHLVVHRPDLALELLHLVCAQCSPRCRDVLLRTPSTMSTLASPRTRSAFASEGVSPMRSLVSGCGPSVVTGAESGPP